VLRYVRSITRGVPFVFAGVTVIPCDFSVGMLRVSVEWRNLTGGIVALHPATR
jgi:hypothetical protein